MFYERESVCKTDASERWCERRFTLYLLSWIIDPLSAAIEKEKEMEKTKPRVKKKKKKLLRKSQLKIRLNERKGLAGVCVERAAAQKSSLKGISGCHAKFYSFAKSFPLWTPKWFYGRKSFQGVFYSVPDYNTILDADVNLHGFTVNNSSIHAFLFFSFFLFL